MKKYILITLLMVGIGTSLSAEDITTRIEEYKKACDVENATACYRLAAIYDYGEGGMKDDFKAVKFYTKACDIGYA